MLQSLIVKPQIVITVECDSEWYSVGEMRSKPKWHLQVDPVVHYDWIFNTFVA